MNHPKPAPLDEPRRMNAAHRIADLACELDYPGTGHMSQMLHIIAKELAGGRAEEIYGESFHRIDQADETALALAAGEATCGDGGVKP